MIQCFLRRHSFLGCVREAAVYELYQAFVRLVREYLLNSLTAWYELLLAQAAVIGPNELVGVAITV